jgi:hypothetical protein
MANHETRDRSELHREVWSTPMKTLAAKYDISDVGLAKGCRKLMIPLPGRGYWAKKEAGQDLSQPPLRLSLAPGFRVTWWGWPVLYHRQLRCFRADEDEKGPSGVGTPGNRSSAC